MTLPERANYFVLTAVARSPGSGAGSAAKVVHRRSHSARNRSRSGTTSTYTMNFHAARVLDAPLSSTFVSTGLSL